MDKTEKQQYIKELKKLRLELSENGAENRNYEEILRRYSSVLPKMINDPIRPAAKAGKDVEREP